MPHYSYVYAARFLPKHLMGELDDEYLGLITACYDRKVRIYNVRKSEVNTFEVPYVIDIFADNLEVLEPRYNVYDEMQLDDDALFQIHHHSYGEKQDQEMADKALEKIMKPTSIIEIKQQRVEELKVDKFSIKTRVETTIPLE